MKLRPRGRPRKYDWPGRFSSNQFTMRRGRDYDIDTSRIVQQLRSYASNRGIRVSVVQNVQSLTVLVVSRPGRTDAKTGV